MGRARLPSPGNPEVWTHVAEQLAADVADRAPQMQMSPGRADLARLLRDEATDADVIMLIGAGDVNTLAEDLVG
ncbi:UDP-N-acetylmuramate-alanine ligase [Streptomyces tendae]|uniref:hypothetical protein n=1 Tax=Streptomyces TaxID=1883 RepID=UPI003838FACD